jgi:hypothetical protein
MIPRPLRFEIERPVDYRFTDVRGAPRMQGRTVNISSSGVLMRTDQKIGVGRKMELYIRMARISPDGPEVDLRLLGTTVRAGEGWVAVQARKCQIVKRGEPIPPAKESRGTPGDKDSIPGKIRGPAA